MSVKVWAPAVRSVEIVSTGLRMPLERDADGYWSAEIPEALLQGGYKYSLDGSEPVPDPRSRWQPEGVHGSSHGVQLRHAGGAFCPAPLRDAVIYEMHVGTFTPEGTYAAAGGKLEHLAGLGVTHVELLPLATFPGQRGWGYDGVDLYAPFPAYGTPHELAAFIDDCHSRGIAVLLDVVYNHLGPDGNYLGSFGPYFTDHYKTGWGQAINYDAAQSDHVRRFVIDNALMWLSEYGFDGLRLDAVHAIFSFEATHVLEQLAREVKELGARLGRELILIAESDLNDPRLVRGRAQGGYELDAHWADDFHHALHRFFTGEDSGYYVDFNGLEDVATALRDGYVYQGQYSPHRQRRHGRPPTGVALHQLVVSAQNHDQIGNRANGERLSLLVKLPELKAIAAMLLLSPFVPMLFQGEEWGASAPFQYFTDHDEELGKLVAEGRNKEFSSFKWQGEVPNPQDLSTFERSKLDWTEVSAGWHADLLAWHRALIALRRDVGFTKGENRAKASVQYDAEARWLTFERDGVHAVFNLADISQRVPQPVATWELLLRSDCDVATAPPVKDMPAHATFIYRERRSS